MGQHPAFSVTTYRLRWPSDAHNKSPVNFSAAESARGQPSEVLQCQNLSDRAAVFFTRLAGRQRPWLVLKVSAVVVDLVSSRESAETWLFRCAVGSSELLRPAGATGVTSVSLAGPQWTEWLWE